MKLNIVLLSVFLILCSVSLAACGNNTKVDYNFSSEGFQTRAPFEDEIETTDTETEAETKKPGNGGLYWGESGIVVGGGEEETPDEDGETRDPDDTAYLIDTETGWITGWW